jgi:hypothetical protein
MLPHNAQRGEVPLQVAGVDLVIAAEMGRLAAVSSRLGCQSFPDLYSRLANVELNAVFAGVELLTVRGDVGKAIAGITLRDVKPCQDAFIKALLFHTEGQSEGNGAAASETSQSPGGSGKGLHTSD